MDEMIGGFRNAADGMNSGHNTARYDGDDDFQGVDAVFTSFNSRIKNLEKLLLK